MNERAIHTGGAIPGAAVQHAGEGAEPGFDSAPPSQPLTGSVPGLIRQLADDLSRLFSSEVALAKAEFREEAAELKKGVAGLSAGIGLAFAGGLFLLLAVVFALAQVMPSWAASGVVGAVAVVIGMVLVNAGKRKMEPRELVPQRTVDALEKDKDTVKRNVP